MYRLICTDSVVCSQHITKVLNEVIACWKCEEVHVEICKKRSTCLLKTQVQRPAKRILYKYIKLNFYFD